MLFLNLSLHNPSITSFYFSVWNRQDALHSWKHDIPLEVNPFITTYLELGSAEQLGLQCQSCCCRCLPLHKIFLQCFSGSSFFSYVLAYLRPTGLRRCTRHNPTASREHHSKQSGRVQSKQRRVIQTSLLSRNNPRNPWQTHDLAIFSVPHNDNSETKQKLHFTVGADNIR